MEIDTCNAIGFLFLGSAGMLLLALAWFVVVATRSIFPSQKKPNVD